MAHVYAGQPDARQAGDIKPSRFRPQYRALSAEAKALHDQIKEKAVELEALFEQAYKLAMPPLPVFVAGSDDGEMQAVAGISASPFDRNPQEGYFADGLKHLELSVMLTIKGLTA